MRKLLVYWILLLLKAVSRLFYTFDWRWVDPSAANGWRDFRLVAILNHTSLFECLFAGGVPNSFLRRMAYRGVVPIASKTVERPLMGFFWRLIAGNVVAISRERDHTWEAVLRAIAGDTMVIILPEGRMKRADGLDKYGRPLLVRGGIADLLEVIPEGEMLLAYSRGLHHIQIPDHDPFPRLFQPVALGLEIVDIAAYRREMNARAEGKPEGFRRAVIADLTARRDRHCFPELVEQLRPSLRRQPSQAVDQPPA